MEENLIGPVKRGMQLTERQFQELTIAYARRCVHERDRPADPYVGAVLATPDGRFFDGAWRGELAANEHAEFTLLERKHPKISLAGFTLYTSLEPCTYRENPSKKCCTDWILERHIRTVVICMLDPNGSVRGNGELKFVKHGLVVRRFDHDLRLQARELNRVYLRKFEAC